MLMETQVHFFYLGMMAPTSPLSLSLSSLCVEVEVYQKSYRGLPHSGESVQTTYFTVHLL
jgi:hypothetical protein